MAGTRNTREPVTGDLIARDMRMALVAGRFNEFIVDGLVRGATDMLRRHGAVDADLELVYVPGAFEIPLVAKKLAASGRFDAVIALGAVVRGATPHFEHVAGECSSGLSRVALDTGVPVAFGVLTVDSLEQAVERAGTKAGNKGAEAALAAIEMVNLLRRIDA